jgi:hypothetical protein
MSILPKMGMDGAFLSVAWARTSGLSLLFSMIGVILGGFGFAMKFVCHKILDGEVINVH